MATTLTSLQNDTISRLNESANTTIGDLPSGTGGASTIATATQITNYLNQGLAEISRRAWPIPKDNCTYTWPIGQRTTPLSSFTTGDTSVLWALRGVMWNGVALDFTTRSVLEVVDPYWKSTVNGTPTVWYSDGQGNIGLYAKPVTLQAVSGDGFVTPAPLVSGTDTVGWLPDDLTKYAVFYACGMLATKNDEDSSLASRGAAWLEEYEDGILLMLEMLRSRDPFLANALGMTVNPVA